MPIMCVKSDLIYLEESLGRTDLKCWKFTIRNPNKTNAHTL